MPAGGRRGGASWTEPPGDGWLPCITFGCTLPPLPEVDVLVWLPTEAACALAPARMYDVVLARVPEVFFRQNKQMNVTHDSSRCGPWSLS